MSPAASPHITCAVFNEIPEALEPNTVHHFIVGQDDAPTVFSPDDARARLGDAFAQEILLTGKFPRSGGAVLAELAQLAGRDDQIDRHRFFLLGEGGQIPFSNQTRSLSRGLRFLVACGRGEPDGPDIFVSAFHPDEGDVEIMAWDRKVGGFNFYRTVGANSAWVFAGNSRQALAAPTQGNGPFESHRSGNLLMKELRAPWIHWESPDARIPTTVFGPTNRLAEHPWFTALDGDGAFTCETDVARPSITRWTQLRFDEIAQAGQVNDPQRILVHIVDTPAVNIVSSFQRGDIPGGQPPGEPVGLPATFFADTEALLSGADGLGIDVETPSFSVPRDVYDAVLTDLDVRLESPMGGVGVFRRPGDTHFAFAVPERAFEDQRALVEARRIDLISDRLAACLLMTDFPNPVFSERRASLLKHVPERADLGAGDFSDKMADTIIAAADGDNPEAEFAELWAAGQDWQAAFAPRLSAYLQAVAAALATREGFTAVYRLAEARRERMREEMAIVESFLLFSTSSVPPGKRAMHADATVVEMS